MRKQQHHNHHHHHHHHHDQQPHQSVSAASIVGSTYKEQKEAWIANQSGSSIHLINLFGLTMVSTFILWAALRARSLRFVQSHQLRCPSSLSNPGLRALITAITPLSDWTLEFILLVFPAICASTLLSSRLLLLNFSILLLAAFVYFFAAEPSLSNKISNGKSTRAEKSHWSQPSSDDDDNHEDDPMASTTSLNAPPIRVSIESAADVAHANAAPPTKYSWPAPSPESETTLHPLTFSRNSITCEPGQNPARSTSSTSSPISPLGLMAGGSNTQDAATPDNKSLFIRPQPFLTVYRSHMMLLTVICILAVDFPAFPRHFSKCETWGTSLMDMGVGSFVFSLGIISALPFLRSPKNRFNPLRGQLIRDARRSLPLILLGSIRVIMVKGVEYPEHVSEYGVHWNFFFTLALLPFAATFARTFSRTLRFNTVGVILSLLHQALLSNTRLQEWAIADIPRRSGESLITQNKEGLVSLPGYLSIFLLGLDAGHYVLPLDPYFAYRKLRRRRAKPKTAKLALVLASFVIIWWAAYASLSALGFSISRRLANLAYVIWVVAFNTLFLLGYVLVYVALEVPAPALLEHVNRHSLAVFLIANLLTGLVNMSIETMYTSDGVSLLILTTYVAACCGFAKILTEKGWRLKL